MGHHKREFVKKPSHLQIAQATNYLEMTHIS